MNATIIPEFSATPWAEEKCRSPPPKGQRCLRIKTGDHWVGGPTEWHEGVNVGDTTVSYLVVEMKY
jgi:hypothetical protein